MSAPASCDTGTNWGSSDGKLEVVVYQEGAIGEQRVLEATLPVYQVGAGSTTTLELEPANATAPITPSSPTARDTSFHAIALDYCANGANWTVEDLDVDVIGFER